MSQNTFPLTSASIRGHEYTVFDRAPYTLIDVLRQSRHFGNWPALRYEEAEWTFVEQWRSASALASALQDDFGVQPGDRVAIAMRNYPEWVIAFWAVQLSRAVAVGYNAWFGRDELEFLCRDSTPKVIFADEERTRALTDLTGNPAVMVTVRTTAAPAGAVPIENLLDRSCNEDRFAETQIDVDEFSTILYTSGTTEKPKGVISTHRNHVTNLLQLQMRNPPKADASGSSATLNVYPMFHIAGLSLAYSAAFNGSCLTLMRKWDSAEADRLIRCHGITSFSGPPLTVRGLLDEIAANPIPSPLRSIGSGGSTAPVSQVREISTLNAGSVRPVTGYGLTETTSTVTAISGPDFVERPTSIGRPLPTVEVRVVDARGDDVTAGDAGELLVRGAQVAVGYHNRPEATEAAFVDGWFHTGDLVRSDDDGFLHIVGRLKDVVIRGGENVSCGEVEGVLSMHPAIAESAVIGLAHPTLGEEVGAVVRLNAGQAVSPEELRTFVAQRLAAFKVPTKVLLTDAPLPRNAAGKVVKSQVRQKFCTST